MPLRPGGFGLTVRGFNAGARERSESGTHELRKDWPARRWSRRLGRVVHRGGRGAILISHSHIDVSGVFAGPRSIRCNLPRPSLAITRSGIVFVLQGLVMESWVGVGFEGQDFDDWFGRGKCFDAVQFHTAFNITIKARDGLSNLGNAIFAALDADSLIRRCSRPFWLHR